MLKFLKRALLTNLAVILVPSLSLLPASAQTNSFQFGFTTDPSPGANSEINFVFNQPTAGGQGFKKITVTVPAGFEFTPSDQLGQDEMIGQGSFYAGPSPNPTYACITSLYNNQIISGGQKAHWRLDFNCRDNSIPSIDVFLTGDQTSGYTFIIEFPPEISLPTPISWGLMIFGISPESGKAVVKNPSTAGTYIGKAEFESPAGKQDLNQVEILIDRQSQPQPKASGQEITENPQKAVPESVGTQNHSTPLPLASRVATGSSTAATPLLKNKFNLPGQVIILVPLGTALLLVILGLKKWMQKRKRHQKFDKHVILII